LTTAADGLAGPVEAIVPVVWDGRGGEASPRYLVKVRVPFAEDEPHVAVRASATVAVTADEVTVKVTEVAPAGMVTLDG